MLVTPTGPSPGVDVTVAAGTRKPAGIMRFATVRITIATISTTPSRIARPRASAGSSAENWKKQTRLYAATSSSACCR
jgi:hypothetical protein